VACLKSRGIDAEVENGFGVLFTDPTGTAYEECQAKVDELMPPHPLMSDRENYEAWVQAAECIRDLGFDVAETPSFEVWVEDRGKNWNPYDDLLGETFWEVHAICPQPGLGLSPSTTVTRTSDS